MAKESTDYKGKAEFIMARAKANATLLAAVGGLLLAGGNFLNDFLDRQHQRQLDESTYSATLAEVRALRKMIASYHPPVEPTADFPAPVYRADAAVVTENSTDDDAIPEPDPEPDMEQAPSFEGIKEYVRKSGKPLRFDMATRGNP